MTTAELRATGRRGAGVGAILWWLVIGLGLTVSAYGLAYVILGDRMYPPDLVDSFRARPWGIYPHALFGSLAVGLGPLQFRRNILTRWRALHRNLGLVYIVSCFMVGAAGLYMSVYSFGGWISHLGFGMLAVILLGCTTAAYRAIRRRDVAQHRRWMLRSYAMIFGAVTLRIELPLLIAGLGEFPPAYRIVSFLAWVPNLLFIEYYIRRASPGVLPVPAGA